MAVIEVCTFRLVGDEGEFPALDARMQTEFAYQQRGLVRRTTGKGSDGEWVVVTLWADEAAADAARAAEADDPVARAFWAAGAPGSTTRRRFTTLE